MSGLEDIFYFDAGIGPAEQMDYREAPSDSQMWTTDGDAPDNLTVLQELVDGRHPFASESSMWSVPETPDSSLFTPQHSQDAEGHPLHNEPTNAVWQDIGGQFPSLPHVPAYLPSPHEFHQWEASLAHESNPFQLQSDIDEMFALAPPSVNDYQSTPDVSSWLANWSLAGETYPKNDRIGPAALQLKHLTRPKRISKDDVRGDSCDIQGIDWTRLGTTREKARKVRLSSYLNPLSKSFSKPRGQSQTFRFRCMKTDQRTHVTHFQLRHLIAAPCRNDVFYAAGAQVIHTNTCTAETRCIMNLQEPSSISSRAAPFSITTLAANSSILLAGGFNGEYSYLALESLEGTLPTEGYVTNADSNITNHIHAFASRSTPLSSPLAAFSSNDRHLRILDTATNQFVSVFAYTTAVNAAATSPDARLRAVVGDGFSPWITDAESGKILVDLCGVHHEDVFAVAWADDGITVATGGQDCRVAIWDARRWDRPLTVIPSTMSCPRSLAFSPVGSGRRLLAIAEAEDIVGIVDAVSWQRQDLDLFGSIGGIALGPDGEELWVANCDAKVGGLMEFERTSHSTRDDWVEDTNLDTRPARTEVERRYRHKTHGGVWV